MSKLGGHELTIESKPLYSFLNDFYSTKSLHFEVRDQRDALEFSVPAPKSFIQPTVSIDAGVGPSPILLISAAAAMGKSLTSQAIAAKLGSPRLDLAKITVGADSHMGTITNSLSLKSFGEFVQRWDDGSTVLVIDSLDEAPLRSGERAYFAFLDSVIRTARQFSVSAHQIIILGRPQTVDFFYDYCADSGLVPSRGSLDALSLEASLDLIAMQIENDSVSTPSHVSHPAPARTWWSNYLFKLGGLIVGNRPQIHADEWGEVSDFLGYPPVVSALAISLDRHNYSPGTVEDADNMSSASDRSQLLSRIVDSLGEREALKVQSSLGEFLADKLPDGVLKTLYSPEEQLQRVLSTLGFTVDVQKPALLPEELRSEYEEKLEVFVADHPFLNGLDDSRPRNLIFSDYLRSLIDSNATFLAISETSARSDIGLLPVGPFYARFMYALCKTTETDEGASIESEDVVSNLMKSWARSAATPGGTHATYIHSDDSLPVLELMRGSDEDLRDNLVFSIREPSGVLELASPLVDSTILTEQSIAVLPLNGVVSIGPRVTLSAREIEASPVDEVLFMGSSASGISSTWAAFMLADGLQVVGDFSVRVLPDSSSVLVFSQNEDPRFRAFRRPMPSVGGLPLRKLYEAVVTLRRILTNFRGKGTTSLSLNADKFSRHIVGRSGLASALASALRDIGYIRNEGSLVVLDQELITKFGLSYDSYQSDEWEDKVLAVLKHCIDQVPSLAKRIRDL